MLAAIWLHVAAVADRSVSNCPHVGSSQRWLSGQFHVVHIGLKFDWTNWGKWFPSLFLFRCCLFLTSSHYYLSRGGMDAPLHSLTAIKSLHLRHNNKDLHNLKLLEKPLMSFFFGLWFNWCWKWKAIGCYGWCCRCQAIDKQLSTYQFKLITGRKVSWMLPPPRLHG